MYKSIFMNFMVEFAKNRWNLYRLNSIYYCFSSEKLNFYWFWQGVRETKIDFDRGSGRKCKTRFDRGSEPNQFPPPPTRPTLPTYGEDTLHTAQYAQANNVLFLFAVSFFGFISVSFHFAFIFNSSNPAGNLCEHVTCRHRIPPPFMNDTFRNGHALTFYLNKFPCCRF